MSQSHLVIDFPIKAPANAKALTDELPPLMPDLATRCRTTSAPCTSRVSWSRETRSFSSSPISTATAHSILSGWWSVLARCSTPSSSTWTTLPPARVATVRMRRQVAEGPRPRACSTRTSRTRTRRCRTSRRAHVTAGFTGNTAQSSLTDVHDHQGKPAGPRLEGGRCRVIAERGDAASDAIGTLHFRHWVPFGETHLAFFTIFDGDFEDVLPGLRRQDFVALRRGLSPCRRRATNPGREERPSVLSVGVGEQPSADRVLQRLSRPRGARHSSPARRSRLTIDRQLKSTAAFPGRTSRICRHWRTR